MSSYVIGDVHGCFEELTKLLDLINYDSNKDKLLFTGDLVNGAPKSVATLEFIKSLGDKAITVLGNHDLTLLALASGNLQQYKLNTSGFDEVLNHEKKQELIEWLRSRPLVHYEKDFNALLIHAGLYPFWSIQKVCSLAEEVEKILASDDCTQLFANMFGNLPDKWNDNLEGWERIRFTINACTRMRFCSDDGRLELITKGKAERNPKGFKPWFEIENNNLNKNTSIIFGHWSALIGITNVDKFIALDTGCIWGNYLTALRLEDNKKFAVACPQYCNY